MITITGDVADLALSSAVTFNGTVGRITSYNFTSIPYVTLNCYSVPIYYSAPLKMTLDLVFDGPINPTNDVIEPHNSQLTHSIIKDE